MSKKKKDSGSNTPRPVQLPRGALYRVDMGDSFAEYDRVLINPGTFVQTPASHAAADPASSKCFFVGRRGTGKTAITLHLSSSKQSAVLVTPQVLMPTDDDENLDALRDT